MNRPAVSVLVLAIALLAPVASLNAAPQESDIENDWRVSSVLDGRVSTADGKPVGRLHDILFSPAGAARAVIVAAHDENGLGRVFSEVEWPDVTFRPERGVTELRLNARAFDELPAKESVAFETGTEFSASDLVGTEVSLDGDAGYGEIADLFINSGANAVTAFVIRPDGERTAYVVPADFDGVVNDRDSLRYEARAEDIERHEVIQLEL